ncbi:MAG TPA: CehA/McbA family metallohydrolase, partial [Armatimonadota bacterium]|nr:CehA/McbA family metallohydrolase [Armatimonadota bacterium]
MPTSTRSLTFQAARAALTVAALGCATWLAAADTQPATLHVHVTEKGTGRPVPCRLTLLDGRGRAAEVTPEKARWLAYRPGVLYTGTGEATFTAPQGRYTLYVNRGLEYGVVTRDIHLGAGERTVDLQLVREVDTTGYVSCDTHIHTLTFSGHGDATIQERMATIAGEGIELAIATDHNHHTDYAPAARETGTSRQFTPVIGNEVTTRVGHFNAFPVRPGSAPPDPRLTDWNLLLPAIRAVPGVRVVTLNHPSDLHEGFIPADPRRFHPASGESLDHSPWSFDGIEVVTSSALHSDYLKPYRDWFALLNRGARMVGLGSSDSHDVSRYILGQGRTYIASSAAEPEQIDIQEACDSLLAGRALVSMGLFTEAWVDGQPVGSWVTG